MSKDYCGSSVPSVVESMGMIEYMDCLAKQLSGEVSVSEHLKGYKELERLWSVGAKRGLLINDMERRRRKK